MTGSSGLPRRRPAGLLEKTTNFHVFLRFPPCVSQLPMDVAICCTTGGAALRLCTDLEIADLMKL